MQMPDSSDTIPSKSTTQSRWCHFENHEMSVSNDLPANLRTETPNVTTPEAAPILADFVQSDKATPKEQTVEFLRNLVKSHSLRAELPNQSRRLFFANRQSAQKHGGNATEF